MIRAIKFIHLTMGENDTLFLEEDDSLQRVVWDEVNLRWDIIVSQFIEKHEDGGTRVETALALDKAETV